MTGYAGSWDYVETPAVSAEDPHISTHPTEKQTPTLSQELCAGYILLKTVRNPHKILARGSESVFQWDTQTVCEVLHENCRVPTSSRDPAYPIICIRVYRNLVKLGQSLH